MSFSRTFNQLYQSILPDNEDNNLIRTNQLVLLNTPYSISTDGSFLIPQLTVFYLKNMRNHKVVLISFLNKFDHYNSISAKLGINLTSAINENNLIFIDCLSLHKTVSQQINTISCPLFDQTNECTLGNLTKIVHDILDKHCTSSPETPLTILIDDLSTPVMMGLPCIEALDFVFSTCGKLGARLAATSTVCVLVASNENIESAEYRLCQHLSFESDITLTVEGLASGFSKEVHGKLTARARKPSPSFTPYLEECHFKLEDRGVKLFAIGTAIGIL